MEFLETSVRTRFGRLRIVWTESPAGRVATRITLPGAGMSQKKVFGEEPSPAGHPDLRMETLAAGIRAFLSGQDVVFDLGVLDLERCGPFQRSVLIAEYGIPRGYVSTYRRIAVHIEHPTAARAVGRALATNPFPIVIPCHRALRSDGSLGGFQGGTEMKAELLRMEGIGFRKDGRVVMERVWY